MSLLAVSGEPQQLTGLTGWIAQIIESAGLLGVGLLVAAENIVPPVPSEIVLALAGYLAGTGRFNLVLVVVAATLGSCGSWSSGYAAARPSGTDAVPVAARSPRSSAPPGPYRPPARTPG